MKKILVIGGYGVFGKRIVERLSRVEGIEIIIAGRSLDKANKLKQSLSATAKCDISAQYIDINQNLTFKTDILINACGPYHRQDYSLAEYCIEQGIHYIDLADNRDFVCGISKLDEKAKSKNVLVTSGASTVPAISSAIIDYLAKHFHEIYELDYGVTPGNQTDRGVSTVEAILSYVGKPFKALRGGIKNDIYGWQDLHQEHYPKIGKRWMVNCNIPDFDLFPERYPALKTHKFYAGLELGILHIGLWFLSWPARWGLIPKLDRFGNALRRVSLWFYNFGTDKGGMHMIVKGINAKGEPIEKRIYLIGENGHGPFIPAIPSVLVARKLIDGSLKTIGATPCMGLFGLDEFLEEVSDLDIYKLEDETLYKRYLGERYKTLPKAVQELHDYTDEVLYEGKGDVVRGSNPFCQFICGIMALPPTGKDQKVSVHFKQDGGAEHWTRHFEKKKYYSKQWDQNNRLYEKIGPTTFVFDIDASEEKLSLNLEKLYSFGIRSDWLFKPKVVAQETDKNGIFHFYIEAHLPLFGLLIKYDGWLKRISI